MVVKPDERIYIKTGLVMIKGMMIGFALMRSIWRQLKMIKKVMMKQAAACAAACEIN